MSHRLYLHKTVCVSFFIIIVFVKLYHQQKYTPMSPGQGTHTHTHTHTLQGDDPCFSLCVCVCVSLVMPVLFHICVLPFRGRGGVTSSDGPPLPRPLKFRPLVIEGQSRRPPLFKERVTA